MATNLLNSRSRGSSASPKPDPRNPGNRSRPRNSGVDVLQSLRNQIASGGGDPRNMTGMSSGILNGGNDPMGNGPYSRNIGAANPVVGGGSNHGRTTSSSSVSSSSQSASNGGSSSAPGGFKSSTSFGKSFSPNYYGEAWSDPESVINQWFNHNKMGLHSGANAIAQQQANNLGLLWMIDQGAKTKSQGTAGYLDWAGKYLGQGFKPGGDYVTPQEVMSSIFSRDQNNPMYQQLYGMDLTPQQQADAVLSTMRYGLEGSMPTNIMESMLSQYNELGSKFKTSRMTGNNNNQSFQDYMRSQGKNAGAF